jgi:hypothetical protein
MSLPNYAKEVVTIAVRVEEEGADLYTLVGKSRFVNNPSWFVSAMRTSRHSDEYANMAEPIRNMDEAFALTPHIIFFALAADVRECMAEG